MINTGFKCSSEHSEQRIRLQVIVGNVTTTGELGKKEKFLVPTT